MKRTKLIFLLCLFHLAIFAGQAGNQIRLSVCYEELTEVQKPNHRASCAPIMATQNGHVLSFASSLAGEIIEVWKDEILQYTSVIEVDGSVEIPNHLLGEFAFCVKHNGKSYRTDVEL